MQTQSFLFDEAFQPREQLLVRQGLRVIHTKQTIDPLKKLHGPATWYVPSLWITMPRMGPDGYSESTPRWGQSGRREHEEHCGF